MNLVAGTWRLARLAARRDRIVLPVWLVAICGLAAAVVSSITALYVDEQERAQAAAFGAANIASRVFDGPASGTTLGAMVMVEAYAILAILISIMSVQAVTRHTRQDEETGRAELLGALPVGRYARLTAALLLVLGANLVVAAGIAAVLLGSGLAVAGALASGAAVGGVGFTFASVAAVSAQVASTQRAANGIAMAVLGAAFLLRAIGDAAGTVAASGVELVSAWPSWLSPLGWGQQIRPFHQNNWEVLGLFLGTTAVLIAIAFSISRWRDLGAGLLSVRPGPPVASAALRYPLGLAWRLQRWILVAWLVGLAIIGAAFGAVGDSVDDFAGISDQFEQMIRQQAAGADLVDLFFAFLMGFLAIAAAGYTVQALLRMRGEESAGHLEPLLATGISRSRWLFGHVLIAGAGTALLLGVIGLSGAAGYTVVTGDLHTGLGMLQAALAQMPAVFALAGFTIAAYGLVPRWAGALAWAALAVSLVMGQLGELLELPRAVLNLSPFTHVPAVPAESLRVAPVLILLGAGVALTAAGWFGFRRRDLAIGA